MAPKPLVYNATLVQRIDLTDALAIFRIQPDQPAERNAQGAWFTAGQYCVIGANNEEKPELGSVRRSMSIASAPEDDGPIEFYIRFVGKPESENPLTHLLWSAEGRGCTSAWRRPGTSRRYRRHHRTRRNLRRRGHRLAVPVDICTEVVDDPRADLSSRDPARRPTDGSATATSWWLAARNHLHYHGTVSRPRDTG
jgi:ferredoxin--NADP+ reductase